VKVVRQRTDSKAARQDAARTLLFFGGMMAQRRSTIVVGVDLSEYSDVVLERALDEASRRERPAIHVVAAVPEPERHWWSVSNPPDLNAAEEDTKRRLGELARRDLDEAIPAERRADWVVRLHVRRGRPERVVAELAAELKADLIVVGRYHRESTADRIVQLADCPVLVAPAPREASANEQCPDCVEVRAQSDGEIWFCPRHHTDRVGHTILVSGSTNPLGTW